MNDKTLVKFHIIDKSFTGAISVVKTFITMGFLYLIVKALAGQTTMANIIIDLNKEFNFHLVYLFLLGVVLLILWSCRHERNTKVQNMTKHMANLERMIDSNRTSSGLTKIGKTHKMDL